MRARVCVFARTAMLGGGGPAQVRAAASDDELRLSEDARLRGGGADDTDDYGTAAAAAAHILKRLVAGDVTKRRFCRQNYVYNPVSGRCQASLLVRSSQSVSQSIRRRIRFRLLD